jgi:hypothetical protein
MRLIPARFASVAYELKYDPDLLEYRDTAEAVEGDSISQAVEKTLAWESISLIHRLPYGDLAVILWNDNNPEETTLTLQENSALFTRQNESQEVCTIFKRFMIAIAVALESPFCILKRDALYTTKSKRDILALVNSESFKNGLKVPIFLAVHEDVMRFSDLEKILPSTCTSYQTGSYMVIHKKTYGSPPID